MHVLTNFTDIYNPTPTLVDMSLSWERNKHSGIHVHIFGSNLICLVFA